MTTLTQQLDEFIEFGESQEFEQVFDFFWNNRHQLRADLALAERVRGAAKGFIYCAPNAPSDWAVFPEKEAKTDLACKAVYIVPASDVEGG